MVVYDPSVTLPVERDGATCQVPFCELTKGDVVQDGLTRHGRFVVGVGAHEEFDKSRGNNGLQWVVISESGTAYTPQHFGAEPVDAAKSAAIGDIVRLGSLFLDDTPVDVRHDGTAGDIPRYSCGSIKFGGATPGLAIRWVKVSENLLIADRNLLTNISWATLDQLELVRGKSITIDGCRYTVGIPTGGEWDEFIVNGPMGSADSTWHWRNVRTICAERNIKTDFLCVLRGGPSSESRLFCGRISTGLGVGFRPMLVIPKTEKISK